ncbi:MAG: hypothetical protein Q8Q26_09965 [Pseudorhodobacter sp.]|nr:hypothetical protein [Pseudorhodobacter sp.]
MRKLGGERGQQRANTLYKVNTDDMTVRRRHHNLGSPDELARSIAVDDRGLRLSTVGGVTFSCASAANHPFSKYRQRIAYSSGHQYIGHLLPVIPLRAARR